MPSSLFCLIDCATDKQLHPLVKAHPGASCLYAGEVHPDLAPAAPYIVELRDGDPLLRAWRTQGRGKNWGVFCESALPLSLVRFHFRHFLQARLPDKRIVEFRFYDPRVFRVYFPTCSPDELVRWFDGLQRFLVEDESGEGTLEYTLLAGRLDARPVRFPTSG